MDLNVRIIHHKDFLETSPSGELDLDKSKQTLLKIASLNKPPHNYDVMIDLRGATPHLYMADITELVQLMIDYRDSFRNKIAILTSRDALFELAKFMELYAQNRGFQVAAFDNFEEAINWLSTSTEVSLDIS